MQHRTTPSNSRSRRFSRLKITLFVLLAGIVVIIYFQFGDNLTLSHLVEHESRLRVFQQEHPVLVYGIAFLAYVTIAGLSVPGASALTLVYGWYFGFSRSVVLVSFASTAGATVAFLLSRFFFRDALLRRFGDRLDRFNDALEREGPFFLFSLRLIPAVPFWVINAVMGLTPIRTRTFWWVSQLGMLAGTIVYVYAGSSVPSLQVLADDGIRAVFTPSQLTQIVIAFTLLCLLPISVRGTMKLVSRSRSANPLQADTMQADTMQADTDQDSART